MRKKARFSDTTTEHSFSRYIVCLAAEESVGNLLSLSVVSTVSNQLEISYQAAIQIREIALHQHHSIRMQVRQSFSLVVESFCWANRFDEVVYLARRVIGDECDRKILSSFPSPCIGTPVQSVHRMRPCSRRNRTC